MSPITPLFMCLVSNHSVVSQLNYLGQCVYICICRYKVPTVSTCRNNTKQAQLCKLSHNKVKHRMSPALPYSSSKFTFHMLLVITRCNCIYSVMYNNIVRCNTSRGADEEFSCTSITQASPIRRCWRFAPWWWVLLHCFHWLQKNVFSTSKYSTRQWHK